MKLILENWRKFLAESEQIEEEYYDSRRDVEGYVDADELIGKRLWLHTNRTHRNQGKNGMIGIYAANEKGKKTGSPLYYTNCVRLGSPIVFQSSESGAERIAGTGDRTLVAGVSGVVKETNEGRDLDGFVEVTFSPFSDNKYFHPVGEPEIKVETADEVYFVASEDGKWKLMARFKSEPIQEKKKKKKKKDDRCTRIAKRKYDTWPSAYASGAVVQCRKGKIWKGLKEKTNETDT